MPSPTLEKLPDGSLRVSDTCPRCQADVVWDCVMISDEGRFLSGHCGCSGERHSFALGPDDRVVDSTGRKL